MATALGVRPDPGAPPTSTSALADPAFACGLPNARLVAASRLEVTPFTQPFRVPLVLEPVDRDARADLYRVRMHAVDAEVVAGTTTRLWTYEGSFPGPTIRAERGREVRVEWRNDLPEHAVVHLHGGHVPFRSDGHPLATVAPGGSVTYPYPNRQAAATLWYHDHVHHDTARNVYRGLAGLYLLDDPAEDALGLPAGDQDLPVVIADRSFEADGRLFHPGHDGSAFFGDVALVNGVPHPVATVTARRYRLRLLNASNSRAYELARSDGRDLVVIGSDGGLLPGPVRRRSVRLYPAERVEVVLDLRGAAGTSVVLEDALGDWPGILRFDVTEGAAGDASQVPATLRPMVALPAPQVTRTLRLQLAADQRTWVIDGRGYDGARIDQAVRLGATERWRLVNESPVEHPMHLHLVMFRVVARDGVAPDAVESGWKDTVTVAPGETVEVVARFDGHTGVFVYHCHNLEHEDRDMMGQMAVVDLERLSGQDRVATAVAVSRARFEPGVPVVYLATAAGFADALAAGPAAAHRGGPLLLTEPEELSAATARELRRLAPSQVVVLGGPRALARSIEGEVAAVTGAQVRRVAGVDRHATAAAVSRSWAVPGIDTVLVASSSAFADALVGSAAAVAHEASLLLSTADELPPATAEELARLRPRRVLVLGGRAAIGDAVVDAIRRASGATVRRIGGADRYATASAVVQALFPDPVHEVLVATGADFPDALSGGPAAAGAPLLLVAPDHVPEVVLAELRRLRPDRIVVLGGERAVPLPVERALADVLARPFLDQLGIP